MREEEFKILSEIIENQKQVSQIEMLFANLKGKTNPCKNFGISREDSEVLGIHRGSLMSSILAMYHEYKSNKK